jgi:hypothetical protein
VIIMKKEYLGTFAKASTPGRADGETGVSDSTTKKNNYAHGKYGLSRHLSLDRPIGESGEPSVDGVEKPNLTICKQLLCAIYDFYKGAIDVKKGSFDLDKARKIIVQAEMPITNDLESELRSVSEADLEFVLGNVTPSALSEDIRKYLESPALYASAVERYRNALQVVENPVVLTNLSGIVYATGKSEKSPCKNLFYFGDPVKMNREKRIKLINADPHKQKKIMKRDSLRKVEE